MSTTNPENTLDHIEELAGSGDIREAAAALRLYLREKKDSDRLRHLDEIEANYRRMLDYFLTGNPDSYRCSMQSRTMADIMAIAADCRRDIRVEDGRDIFSTKARFENLQNVNLKFRLNEYRDARRRLDAAIDTDTDYTTAAAHSEQALTRYFYKLWTSRNLNMEETDALREIFSPQETDTLLQAQTINALFLRGLDFFDHNIILFLADTVESASSEKIVARAMVTMILLMMRHLDKLEENHMIRQRLELWGDNLMMYPRLREVVKAIIKTRDTDRISDTMKSEVIPGLMKMRPDIMKKMRDISEGLDAGFPEENPEWEEMLDKSGLTDKLRELSELQSDGADVMMVAFSNLKNFPFFSELANWLLPFYPQHSALSAMRKIGNKAFETMLNAPALMMCDSDKYSLALSMDAMPEAQRNMMSSQFEAQMDQLREEEADKLTKSTTPEFDREANMYVRDLYRFFHLFPRKDEFYNPFSKVLDLTRLPAIGDILVDSEILGIICEFYFKRKYYSEAFQMFRVMARNSPDDAARLEKMGFCCQKLGEIELALEYYDRATLMAPESTWLMKKRAFCNRQLGNFAVAAEIYRSLIARDPENVALVVGLADCLAAEDRLPEALKEYYKADYLRPGEIRVQRAIAWNELRSGNFDKSRTYHEHVLSGNPDGRDFINAAHTAFLAKDIPEASRLYREAASRYKNEDDFRMAVKADFDILEELGAEMTDLRLMLDAIGY